jgi:hypothetical protein
MERLVEDDQNGKRGDGRGMKIANDEGIFSLSMLKGRWRNLD